eukprot:6471791-Amphidinium_carterae.4
MSACCASTDLIAEDQRQSVSLGLTRANCFRLLEAQDYTVARKSAKGSDSTRPNSGPNYSPKATERRGSRGLSWKHVLQKPVKKHHGVMLTVKRFFLTQLHDETRSGKHRLPKPQTHSEFFAEQNAEHTHLNPRVKIYNWKLFLHCIFFRAATTSFCFKTFLREPTHVCSGHKSARDAVMASMQRVTAGAAMASPVRRRHAVGVNPVMFTSGKPKIEKCTEAGSIC